MKKYALATVMVVLLAAGYSQRSEAAPCVQASLATYIAQGSCTIDDKTFSAFVYATVQPLSGSQLPTAAQVTVTPLPGDELLFTASWTVDAGQTGDVSLIYTVTSSGNLIDDLDVVLTGTSFAGTGTVTDTTHITGTGLDTSFDVTLAAPSHHFVFTPISSIKITEDTVFNGGSAGVNVSILDKTVSQATPEPTSLALLGVGLFGLAALRRRKTLR